MELTALLSQIKYIGDTRAATLAKGDLHTVRDLLNDFPYGYEDTTDILSISTLYEKWQKLPVWESVSQRFTIKAKVFSKSSFRSRRGMVIVKATFIEVETDKKLNAVWFNQPYLVGELAEGTEFLLFGKVITEGSRLSMQAPRIEKIVEGKDMVHIGRISPLYHSVRGISSSYFRRFFTGLKDTMRELPEFISAELLEKYALASLALSYEKVHFPLVMDDGIAGKRRLEVQELLELKAELDAEKKKVSGKRVGVDTARAFSQKVARSIGSFLPLLPFTLTKGQQDVLQHIVEQIAQGEKIDTFVYGDVGSGKTIIALLLACAYAKEGLSSILMAPTTILALQHVQTAERLLEKLSFEGMSVAPVLSGVKKLTESTAPVLYIGTQALLHNKTLGKNEKLALVVIDEQHRFGVEQRQYLSALPSNPHLLTLSATPIPRTLALSFLGFSDAAFLSEKPIGRLPVITKVVPDDKVEDTYLWIKKRVLDHKEQAFMVFPRIVAEDESDKQSLLAMKKALEERYFKDIPCGLLYGSMSEKEKDSVMTEFREGKTRLLFSTTVIEVGVDIPNAIIIAIHGAEMYGLAQLHQLRGRVGRSDIQSYCLLFTQHESELVAERLQFFAEHSNGIDLAEYDLQHRGSGHLAGAVQAGASDLKIATLTDIYLIQQAVSLYDELQKSSCRIVPIIRVKSAGE